MLIVVNKLSQMEFVVGYTVFNTDNGKFETAKSLENCYYHDIDKYAMYDYMSNYLWGKSTVVLGYSIIKGHKYYIINFGRKSFYIVAYKYLCDNINNILNIHFDKANRLRFYNNKAIPDITHLCKNEHFEYIDKITNGQIGSVGQNEKFLGRHIDTGLIGVVKFPLRENMQRHLLEYNDARNEVICYNLGKLFGVHCCRVIEGLSCGKYCVLSVFEYDMRTESICSLRKTLARMGYSEGDRFNFNALINKYGEQFRINFLRIMAFDYVTCQADRHMSNIAIYNNDIYPLYDNGRSLALGIYENEYTDNQKFILRYNARGIISKLLKTVDIEELKTLLNKYKLPEYVVEEVVNRYQQIKRGVI